MFNNSLDVTAQLNLQESSHPGDKIDSPEARSLLFRPYVEWLPSVGGIASFEVFLCLPRQCHRAHQNTQPIPS